MNLIDLHTDDLCFELAGGLTFCPSNEGERAGEGDFWCVVWDWCKI